MRLEAEAVVVVFFLLLSSMLAAGPREAWGRVGHLIDISRVSKRPGPSTTH